MKRLLLSDRFANLLEENVDVAIRIRNLEDCSMIATRVGSIRHVIYASPTYFATHGRLEKPQDFCDHECITLTMSSVRRCCFSITRSSCVV